MKNLYFLFIALLSVMFVNAQTTATFEDGSFLSSSDVIMGPLASGGIVANPDGAGKVLQVTYGDPSGWDNHAGFQVPPGTARITGGTITFKLKTDHGADAGTKGYMLKIEGGASGNIEKGFAVAGDNTWETISVDMSDCAVGNPNGGNCSGQGNSPDGLLKLLIFHWGGGADAPAGNTFYLDDVSWTDGAVVTAPQSTVEAAVDGTELAAFDGPTYTEANGVATITNINGATSGANNNPWGHIQYSPTGGFDFSTQDRGVAIRVKGPRSIPIKVKFEGNNFELDQTYTNVGDWQTLQYDLSTQSTATREKVVIFFDINNAASADLSDDVFLMDRFTFGEFATLSNSKISISDVSLYPNPAKDFVNISAAEKIDFISIYDLTGRVVLKSEPNKENFNLNVTDLSKGVYLVKLNAGDKESTIKLIK